MLKKSLFGLLALACMFAVVLTPARANAGVFVGITLAPPVPAVPAPYIVAPPPSSGYVVVPTNPYVAPPAPYVAVAPGYVYPYPAYPGEVFIGGRWVPRAPVYPVAPRHVGRYWRR